MNQRLIILTLKQKFGQFIRVKEEPKQNRIKVNTSHIKSYSPFTDFNDFCKYNHLQASQVTNNGYIISFN